MRETNHYDLLENLSVLPKLEIANLKINMKLSLLCAIVPCNFQLIYKFQLLNSQTILRRVNEFSCSETWPQG